MLVFYHLFKSSTFLRSLCVSLIYRFDHCSPLRKNNEPAQQIFSKTTTTKPKTEKPTINSIEKRQRTITTDEKWIQDFGFRSFRNDGSVSLSSNYVQNSAFWLFILAITLMFCQLITRRNCYSTHIGHKFQFCWL